MQVASGSYEGCLFGWTLSPTTSVLTQTWGFKACTGAIRCMAISSDSKYLVCGGADERIHIFDMESKKSLGELSQHTGAITSIKFFNTTHLISSSEDMTLCIWRISDWECVHILGGHKASVTDLAIHPSGRCAFTRRLKGQAAKIHFDYTGDAYLTVIESSAQVYQSSDNSLLCTISHKMRINQALFLPSSSSTSSTSSSRVLTLGEDKILKLTIQMTGEELMSMDMSALGGRPRDMWVCDAGITVVSSSGVLVAMKESALVKGASFQDTLLATHRVAGDPRLICVVAWTFGTTTTSSDAQVLTAVGQEVNVSKKRKTSKGIDSEPTVVVQVVQVDSKTSKKKKNKGAAAASV